jgi:hypothetical protein
METFMDLVNDFPKEDVTAVLCLQPQTVTVHDVC